jgi:hypothetical protein
LPISAKQIKFVDNILNILKNIICTKIYKL